MADVNLFPNAPRPPTEEELARTRRSPDAASIAVSQSVTALGARLRVLEERYNNLRHKTQVTDQNMLELEKGLKADVKRMLESLEETKKELDEVSRRSLQLAEEMRNTVKQSDFRVIEKYLEFWDPLQFVTRDEMDEMLGKKHPKSTAPQEEEPPIAAEEHKPSLFDS